MTKAHVSFLKKEKNILINEYMKAPPKDKTKILVKIIDIDDKLDDIEKKPEKEKAQ